MLREIAQALEELAAQRPIVLWFEDLHWSDPSSLAVIAFLAGRRDAARLMVIGTFRPGEALLDGAPLRSLALRLQQRGQAVEIELGLLDAAAVTLYLQNRLGPSAQVPFDDLGAFVHRRTEGHALFAVAVVDDLVARGVLHRADGVWRLRGPVRELGVGLPGGLLRIVNDQLERLPPGDRRVIEAAAVAGPDFTVVALASALDADVAEVEERCARLADQGRFLRACALVVWPDGTQAPGYAFVHALYWQGIHERVSPSRRADWQRRIGHRLEQAYGTQCGTVASELAMRFEIAGDHERSLRYLQLAGTGALSRGAYPECIELLRHALTLVHTRPTEMRARQELELLLPLGAALMAQQGYAAEEVEVTYRRAFQLCALCAGSAEQAQSAHS
jgi:predicted ATPase